MNRRYTNLEVISGFSPIGRGGLKSLWGSLGEVQNGGEVEGRRVRNAKKCAMGHGHMGRLL